MSSKHRAYLPTNAHSNQYILAEIKPSDEFYQAFKSSDHCYDKLSRLFFRLAEDEQLTNVHFIANDKLPVVRFHTEALTFQTDKQILFFYNPNFHEAQNAFIKPDYKARKIRMLFLATGHELRANAATFHSRVRRFMTKFKAELPDIKLDVKVRDHQHLSYDLFAKSKGHKETYAYKLRALYPRYQARKCDMPEKHSEITYVTVTLPLTRRLKHNLKVSHNTADLYQSLQDSFSNACKGKELNRLAMVANGKTPLVRNSQVDVSEENAELQKISFDPTAAAEPQLLSFWQPDNLVEVAHFIIVAGQEDKTELGYGHFVNRVEAALHSFAKNLALREEKDDVIVRFYQHISYIM